MGISSGASSLDDSSDELQTAFFDFLEMVFFREARGETDFLDLLPLEADMSPTYL
jgi:hypothetical protein